MSGAAPFRLVGGGTKEIGLGAWENFYCDVQSMGRSRIFGMGGRLFRRQEVPRRKIMCALEVSDGGGNVVELDIGSWEIVEQEW